MERLLSALNAGWFTIWVMGTQRVMYHRLHGKCELDKIPETQLKARKIR